jgi:glycosyltransferase involved in cell wall biosynthesis
MNRSAPVRTDSSASRTHPIGVIIPTYNRSEVLFTCLRHLEQQDTSDFEVVIVDDGSTDVTPQLLEEYQRQTPLNLRCIRQDNGGPAHARNKAISILRAPVCLIIGDDIFASPGFVSQHLQLHRQRPEIQVAGLGLTRWCESGQTVTPFMRWLDESGVQFGYNDLLRGVRPSWRYFYTSNLSLKTQLLRENPFNELFKKAAAEDIELGFRLERQHKLEVVFIAAALAHHLHATSFRRACQRNIHVGESMQLFHQLWPDAMPPLGNSPTRRKILKFMLKNPWLLAPLTIFADLLTRIWCPNIAMRETLNYCYNLGYQKGLSDGHDSDLG